MPWEIDCLSTATQPKLTVIGSVNIDNRVTNNCHNIVESDDFYVDFSSDNIVVFPNDAHLNELFIQSLLGTDLTLSKFATEFFKERYHCTSQGHWYRFVNHCWTDDAAEISFKEALSTKEFLQPFRQAAGKPLQSDDVKRKARMVRKLYIQLGNGEQRERIVRESIMKFHALRPDFARDLDTQNIMVFENGVYSFDSFTFGPGNPDVPVTMQVPFPFVPYDPQNEHVRFLLQFMADILPDPEVCTYMLKVMGVCLTMDMSLQLFWVLTGSGSNGKRILLNLLEECAGPYFHSLSSAMLTRPSENTNEALASLVKARLAVFDEPKSDEVLQSGVIRSINGGNDTLSFWVNGKQTKFRPRFKSFLIADSLPAIPANCKSNITLSRRLRIIHFSTSFADASFYARLNEAAPHFSAILIHYYQLYRREGLREPDSVGTLI